MNCETTSPGLSTRGISPFLRPAFSDPSNGGANTTTAGFIAYSSGKAPVSHRIPFSEGNTFGALTICTYRTTYNNLCLFLQGRILAKYQPFCYHFYWQNSKNYPILRNKARTRKYGSSFLLHDSIKSTYPYLPNSHGSSLWKRLLSGPGRHGRRW